MNLYKKTVKKDRKLLPATRQSVASVQFHLFAPNRVDEKSAPYNWPMGLNVEDREHAYIQNPYDTLLKNYTMSSKFKPKRVVVLSKMTRWEIMANRRVAIADDVLRQKHDQQNAYVDDICDQLKKHEIEVKVVKAYSYSLDAIKNAELIISAGGDGTFLTAASLIRDQTPVIGINTDPVGSEGHLCLTGKEDRNVREVIDRFLDGNFRFFPRQRIRVTILSKSSDGISTTQDDALREGKFDAKFRSEEEETIYKHEIVLPLLALNEVFVGESHAARVSYLEIQFDDGPVYKQKNSGVIVCTGTGSTSWHYNVNRLTEQNFTDIISKMRELGYTVEPPIDNEGIAKLCQQYNERLIFAPDDKKIMYSLRDPVFNYTYPKIPPRGTASRIRIKSKCSHAHLTLDGSTSIPFNHGTEVLIELHEKDALQTALLT
ncbi:NAD(+) kinase [Aphelenchoides besseyi]|nr:NAD(+) kinase [Aphelenchoides besseyi]